MCYRVLVPLVLHRFRPRPYPETISQYLQEGYKKDITTRYQLSRNKGNSKVCTQHRSVDLSFWKIFDSCERLDEDSRRGSFEHMNPEDATRIGDRVWQRGSSIEFPRTGECKGQIVGSGAKWSRLLPRAF